MSARVRRIALLSLLFAISSASSAAAQTVSLAVDPILPATSTVGETDRVAQFVITNTSAGVGPVTLTNIALTPSCGNLPPGCNIHDRGVFSVSSTGSGGAACAGNTFAVTETNANTGELSLTPNQPVVLGQPGSGNHVCLVTLIVATRKVPQVDLAPAQFGTQTSVRGTASGTAASSGNGQPVAGSGSGSRTVTVHRGTVSLNGEATPQATLGEPISNTILVSFTEGGAAPTGTVSFIAFGPDDATCTGVPAFQSSPQPVGPPTAISVSAHSGPFVPQAVGHYRWVASYSGDANYLAGNTPCGAPNQTSLVAHATPGMQVTASPDVTVGGALSDSATITGAAGTPTGTVRFDLYGPDNATCGGTPLFSKEVVLAGGTGASGDFSPTALGTYRWIATYSGDAKYLPASTACGAPSQTRTVAKATPVIAQTPSGTVDAGQAVSDRAALSGGAAPTGTLTFRLFGPGGECAGTPVATVVRDVAGNGEYSSGDVVVSASGNYQWVVGYSGDARNAAVTTECGKAPVAVTQPASSPPPVQPPVVQPPVVIVPVAPAGLTALARPRRDRRIPYAFRVTGKLALPTGVAAAAGCTGQVSVRIKNGRKTISTRRAALRSDCTYSRRVSFTQKHRLRKRGGRLKVLVTFLGNPRLKELAAPVTSVRYG